MSIDNIQPGQTLGPYRILHQVGQGGMATVYKAYHAAMDRYVAVKVLPTQLAQSAEFAGRFQQEARLIARLEHPHILPVHDYGESQGIAYLVMRFLEAGTLKDRLQAGPLSRAEIDRLFTQLAEALTYAHEHGVIHRDLKPSNCMVDARGNLFLTDFGIAKLLEGSPNFTSTGAMMGTPAYMSPEQAQGAPVDQRTDVYSLGIILYEMVVGRVPFEAETPLAVVLKHLQDPLPPPSSLKPDLPPAIERVLLKALAKSPEDRFVSVADFLAAWRAALSAAETVHAPSAELPLRSASGAPAASAAPTVVAAAPSAARPGLPGRWLLGAAGLLLVIVVVAFLAFRIGRQRLLTAARLTQTAAAPADTAVAQASPLPATIPVEPTAKPVPTSAPIVPGQGQWSSWTSFSADYLQVHGDGLYAYGSGGITVWDPASGTVRQRFTTADGLPNWYVYAVLFDDETGGMWVGTDDGLALLENGEWIYYTPEDGLDSNVVSALAWTQYGLLAGTSYSGDGGGLNVWTDGGWQPLAGFPSASHDEQPDMLSYNVQVLLEDQAGVLWVGTLNGLGRYDGQSWTRFSTEDGLPDNNIYCLLDDGETIWVGTNSGAARFDGERFVPVENLDGRSVHGIVQDDAGRMWFSGGGGIARYDPGRNDWKVYDDTRMPTYTMLKAIRDDAGNLYFGSENGQVVRFAGNDLTIWETPNAPQVAAVDEVLPAPDGTVWFVRQYGSWLGIFDPGREQWLPVPDLPGRVMLFDPRSRAWLSDWDNGVWVVDGSDQTHLTTEHGLPSNIINAMALEPGTERVWLGTEDAWLALVDLAQGAAPVVETISLKDAGLTQEGVRALYTTADGSLWVSTHDPRLARRLPSGEWEPVDLERLFGYPEQVSAMAQAADGALWLATDGVGAWRYLDGEWTGFRAEDPGVDLPSNEVRSVAAAPDGSLWFATDRGAARWDGTWTVLGVKDGLISDDVYDIYVEPGGTVWLATGGGVTRYVP